MPAQNWVFSDGFVPENGNWGGGGGGEQVIKSIHETLRRI